MKRKLAVTTLLLTSFFANAVDFATEGIKYNDLAGMNINAVHILSKSLQAENKRFLTNDESVLSVEYLGSSRTEVNTLMVVSMFRNRASTPVVLEARTLYLGDGGMPLDDQSSWQRLFIDANGTATYRENSFKTDAVKYYRIEVRESK